MSTKDGHLKDDFLRAYLQCALWAETDESNEQGGDPLDANYDLSDFSPEALELAAEECTRFQEANAADLAEFYAIWPKSPDGDSSAAFGGHNFWLTRNGHGTGFWDRDAGEAGDRLTEACAQMSGMTVNFGLTVKGGLQCSSLR